MLVVGVQGEDAVHGALEHRVDHIGLAGGAKHHAQEIARVGQVVLGVQERLADAVIRHRLKVLAVANGQRVPEDWHRLSAGALVQRAMKGGGSASWRMEPSDVQLVFSTPPRAVAGSSLQF